MKPNRENERLFKALVDCGDLWISPYGDVVNKITGRAFDRISNAGYIQVSKKVGGCARHIMAHRLVWICLVGEIPDEMVINHRNGIKSDNRLENLECVSVSENNQHAIDTGLFDTASTSRGLMAAYAMDPTPWFRISPQIRDEIRRKHAESRASFRAIGRHFGICHTTVAAIVREVRGRSADLQSAA